MITLAPAVGNIERERSFDILRISQSDFPKAVAKITDDIETPRLTALTELPQTY